MSVVTEQYDELWAALHSLRDAWLELRITVQDRPRGDENALVTRLEEEVDDGVTAVDEAIESLLSRDGEPDEPRARGRALAVAQKHLERARARYWRGAGSYERQLALSSLGRRRGGEWAAWVPQVDTASARVPDALEPADEAMRRAWLDLVETASSGSISVTASSIGQQISVSRHEPDPRP